MRFFEFANCGYRCCEIALREISRISIQSVWLSLPIGFEKNIHSEHPRTRVGYAIISIDLGSTPHSSDPSMKRKEENEQKIYKICIPMPIECNQLQLFAFDSDSVKSTNFFCSRFFVNFIICLEQTQRTSASSNMRTMSFANDINSDAWSEVEWKWERQCVSIGAGEWIRTQFHRKWVRQSQVVVIIITEATLRARTKRTNETRMAKSEWWMEWSGVEWTDARRFLWNSKFERWQWKTWMRYADLHENVSHAKRWRRQKNWKENLFFFTRRSFELFEWNVSFVTAVDSGREEKG